MRPKPYVIAKKPMLKPEFHRTRPEVKTVAKTEGSVAKAPAIKTPAVTTKRVPPVAKQETKKAEPTPHTEVQTDTKAPLPTAPKNVCGGHYELNALMTKMVDAELQDIMTKVMQELPDSSPNETESMVVDTLKKKGRVDLKNVIGLNVTMRLLNVFNPLGVKVKFNGKPEKEELREFLKKYNFTAFARKAVNIFAAQVRSIADFDKICNDDDVRCGNVKVTVTPVYRFTACPPNLKTNYKDIESEDFDTEYDEDIEMKDLGSKPAKAEKSENNQPAVSNTSTTKSLEAKKSTEAIKETEPSKATVTKQVATKAEDKKTSPQKSTKVESSTKVEMTSGATETKVTPTKPVTKVTPTKPVTKVTPTKPVTKVTPTKPASKVSPTNPVTKNTTQKPTISAKKSTKVDNDYDELNDHDILALMSEGIVLDECSGSDEE